MTQLPLSKAIVGGGIAGLSTALAISKQNRPNTKITIYESQPQLSELGAGIQVSPNATRILDNLGVDQEFRKVANQPQIMSVHRYEDDSLIGEVAQNPQSFLTMPDGPDQQKRDQMFAAITASWKKDLQEGGEEAIRAKAKATKPDSQAEDMKSPEVRMYLYGYEAAEEARKAFYSAAAAV